MRTDPYSLEHVDAMIDLLESKIKRNELSQKLLSAMQNRLDSIEATHRDRHPSWSTYYHRLLELQALIYGESNQEDKALQFMKEAVRQAGSVRALYSGMIRNYIASHAQAAANIVAAPQFALEPAMAVADAPVEQMDVQPEPVPVAADPAPAAQAPAPAAPAPTPKAQDPAPQQSATADARMDYELAPAPRAEKRERSFKIGRLKIAFVVLFGLVVVGGAAAYFLPSRAFALPGMLVKYSEIQEAKKTYDRLTVQYDECSSKLAGERGDIDTYSTAAVDSYNQATQNCKGMLTQQQQAADRYNKLIGLN